MNLGKALEAFRTSWAFGLPFGLSARIIALSLLLGDSVTRKRPFLLLTGLLALAFILGCSCNLPSLPAVLSGRGRQPSLAAATLTRRAAATKLVPTFTPTMTLTPTPSPTDTPVPTNTPEPTHTPVPTDTPAATETPVPPDTAEPEPPPPPEPTEAPPPAPRQPNSPSASTG